MNRAFRLLAILLLVVSALILPVMAAPAQKESFTAVQVPNSTPPPSPDYKMWVTDGYTYHSRDFIGAGMIWFGTTIPSGPPTGTTSSVIMSDINVKTGEGNMKFEMTWTIGEGSYEGNIIGKMVAPPYSGPGNYDTYLHRVLQGKGAFAGQTVQVDGTKLVGKPFEWTGTIMTP
jgi:hypothetical protein